MGHSPLVELTEVEHHIRKILAEDGISGVSATAEVISLEQRSNPILVAFLSANKTHGHITEEQLTDARSSLERKLGERVPAYMVPAAYIAVDSIPTTATGKTDRRQLRRIGSSMTMQQLAELDPLHKKRRPLTNTEQRLQGLWAEVLDVDRAIIGAGDSFLHMGDSIAAMQLVAKARLQGLALTVADVFKQPRLCDMVKMAKQSLRQEGPVEPFSLLKQGIEAGDARRRAAIMCGVNESQIEDLFPCTPLQEGLLALTARRNGDYINHTVLRLQESIDENRFRTSVEEVASSAASILRARIVSLPDQGSVQAIIKEPVSWSTGNSINDIVRQHSEVPMDLGEPLARYGVAKDCSHHGVYFVLTLHHALYDGWSMQLLLEQIARTYCSQQQSKNSPPQFQCFVQSTTRLNNDSVTNYWECQLENCGAPTYPPLPSASYQPRIDDSVLHNVSDLKWPQRSNITPSTLVRATWALVVASYTNSSDVLFGATVTGRQAAVPGVEYMIGPTIATVPIRTLLDWDQSVSKLLQQVQAQGVEMTEFEQTGLQQIRRIRDCQFQTLLVVQPAQTSQNHIENSVFELDTQEGLTAATAFGTYAISVECQLEDDGLELQLHFDSNVITDAQQPKRMGQQFEHLLRLLCDPSKGVFKLSQLQRISSHDLETVWQWNATVPATADQCVHDLFTQLAQQQPQAPAIHAWDGNLTYGEVETLSNRLAYHLIDLGVSPGTIIPLCFEKSVWTSVAMLAVMKVGATSVALDITQPEDRLWAIISQVRPGLTISSTEGANVMARVASRIPEYKSNVVVNQGEILSMPLEGGSLPMVDVSTALYLAFTSGSTGVPKGVIITHNNFSSGIKHQQKTARLQPRRSSRKNNLSRSILELGANRVTLTSTVLDVLDDSVIKRLDVVETGGEAVSQRQIDRVAQNTQCRIAYGPVECTVGVTWAWGDLRGRDIGKGLGACTWVVDPSSGSLAGVGCIGELWIEGPLVGHGYLNDPAKTAESFIEDPDWLVRGSPGLPGRRGRLYKTGDLVRYKPDGSLVFIGRKDTQVKLRGQRIELSEVEHHVLGQLAGRGSVTAEGGDAPQVVAEVIKPQSRNSDMLIAFVSPPGGGSMTEDECARTVEELTTGISHRLADAVPVYMVPSGYIPIQTMPRMTTGKTDRRLLRQRVEKLSPQELATLMSPLSSQSRRPVSTTAERELQQLWADILGLVPETITADDSFFILGGDSIHAMRLAGAARSQGLVLTVADIFSSPGLSSQAKLLRAENGTEESVEPFSLLGSHADTATARKDAALLCTVAESQIDDIFPCTPLQEGLLAMTARRSGDYINQTIRELQSNIDPLQFQRSWEALAAATPILRTRVVDLPSYGLVQVVIQEPVKWLTYNDVSSPLAQQQHEQLAMGLGTPLSRVGLYTDPETFKTSFVWSIHHVLYDGWSIPLLLDAVEKIHADAWSGSLIAPFQPFIKHVVESNSGGTADQFWKNQFAGSQAPQFPSLPSAGFQPRADIILDRRVEQLGQSPSGFTMATTIRAAWAALLSNATSSPDVVFGAVVSGRQAPIRDIERMAGPTIATVPVRALLDSNVELRSLLSEIQDNATRMTQFEQTGLQNIQRVSPEAQEACRFQTLLVVQPAKQESNDNAGTVFESTRALDDSALGGTDGFSTYAMMLTCEQNGQGLDLSLSIDSRMIENSRGERLLDQFEYIIRQLCSPENAHNRLGKINMLSPRDLHDIWTWNAVLPATSSNCIHSLFSQTAQRQPSALAVEAWDGTLTYGELDGKSTRLAHHLLSLGIDTASQPIVPLCFEKSVWTPVAMLAVMKIGAAAVALDVTQPEGRLLAIIKQAMPTLTISSAQGAALMSRISSCINIPVDETMFAEQLPVTQKEPPLPQVSPESTLYLAFTSGSTGEPKGVMISHSNFSSLVQHQGHMFSSDCRVFDFASYAFDVAWYNIFQTLIVGGCLCTPSESDRKNDIAGSITRLRANQATLTATVTDILPDSVVRGLRVIETGGEAVTQAQIDRLTSLTKVRIAYGPVECTIGVTWAVEDLFDRAIGRGYGACTWVVDTTTPEPTLASVGSVGELWIEGPLVGQGYLNDPDKTAASFVQDPSFLARGNLTGFPGRKGRLYKTGDLVRYNQNGSLTFVGRKDTQIKIRGQRVELSEVEHHVSRQLRDNEAQAVAEVATPRGSDTTALVVFIIPAEAETMSEEELSVTVADMTTGLNSRLAAAVPIYMVPFGYIPLRSVPMMATGKTNRRQLRQQISQRSTQELSALVSARSHKRLVATAEEKELQKLWAAVLSLDPQSIAADDSFLGIGGDSIQAMRLAAAAQRDGWSLSVADILSKSFLFEMAQCLGLASRVSATRVDPFSLLEVDDVDAFVNTQVPGLLPVWYGPVEDILPVSHTQNIFLSGSLDGTPVGIHNFFLDLPSSLDISRLAKSCARLIQNFEILRTVFISHGNNYYQVVLRYLPVSFEVRDVQDDLPTSFDLLCRELDGQPPSLGQTLLRLVLLRTEEGYMRLVIRIFHGQYDGLGFGRLLGSLADLYHGQSIPQEPSLSSLISAQQSPLDYSYWASLLQDSSISSGSKEQSTRPRW
ncbi:hypothetical protein NM208_g11390 [Fusarium decemcellulare]|uniref:Uncharacterized protein n=1 Tax=Fusarium decemcellulare TaxID=57161 RepID=A0ACC1RU90_9HYPO|nr:hypothetical protein NM208_g11390 [Fusarium decemcellulare]